MAHAQLVADLKFIEVRGTGGSRRVVGNPDPALGAHCFGVVTLADGHDVHVVHHHLLHGRLDRRVDVLGGDADDGGVQRVHAIPSRIGEGVRHGDQVPAGDPAHRSQFDVDMQFVPGNDGAVLLEHLFGLHVGVVADDHRLEHQAIAGHARSRGERQRRHQFRVAQRRRGIDIPVHGVIVLHGPGVLTDLLAADQIGAVHLVVVADPGFEIRRL